MINKLLMWGTVFGILSALILPTVYVIFSFWWLLSGDMVTRLTYFSTSFITTLIITIIVIIFSTKKGMPYRGDVPRINKLKEIYKNL